MAVDNNSPDIEASSLVSQVISTWRSGSTPNAKDILQRHPHLRDHHSLVLDLVYEEFCLRRESGERVVVSTFCDRFSTVRKSLRVLLAAHECVEEQGLEDGPSTIPWPETETLFLGFYLIREIGRGAFARVYLATEPSLGDRLVVVKISRRGGGEAETLGRLTHRNIVPVYSVQEDEATQLTAICMPYLGSGTLLRALDTAYDVDQGPAEASLFFHVGRQDSIVNAIPEEYTEPDPVFQRMTFVDSIVHVVAQLSDALSSAHDAGICHRDLKPSNVLLAPSGRPLLLDFNLSSNERLDRTLIGGTLPYMPPEQLRTIMVDDGEDSSFGDPRSDIFSMGVIIYELLTGRLPFGDQDPHEAVHVAAFRILAKQEEGARPIASYGPDLDPQLVKIVERCLQLEPADRFQTAQELATQLRNRLSHLARLRRWGHRRRFLLGSTAAVFSLAAAATGIGLAARPPYVVRQYVAGVGAFEENDLLEAVEYFTNAHQQRPDLYEPLFARGQVSVKLEKYEEAADDLAHAYDLEPGGLIAAWAGYASQLALKSTPSFYFFRQAMDVHQYETVSLLNNIGFRCRRSEDSRSRSSSFDYLSRAIDKDPNCQFAYLNRAMLLQTSYNARTTPDGVPCHQQAIQDVELGLQLDPSSAQAHFVAAFVHSAANQSPSRDAEIVRHLRGALDNGYDRQKLLFQSGFKKEHTEQLIDYEVSPSTRPVPVQQLLLQPPHYFPELKAD